MARYNSPGMILFPTASSTMMRNLIEAVGFRHVVLISNIEARRDPMWAYGRDASGQIRTPHVLTHEIIFVGCKTFGHILDTM